jgi:hypothetical protein
MAAAGDTGIRSVVDRNGFFLFAHLGQPFARCCVRRIESQNVLQANLSVVQAVRDPAQP